MQQDLNYYCWVVAYIDTTFLSKVQKELDRYSEYAEVEAYIPTVKVLKKTFKKENHFEEVPLLFNYGFFKIPRKFAVHQNYLDQMQKNISCIFAWVKDPLKAIKSQRDANAGDSHIPVATATPLEITQLIKAATSNSLHGSESINQLKPGMVITLRGYPWDGMQAEIKEIYHKKKKALVNVKIFDMNRPAVVSFDNIFFTIYHNESMHNDAVGFGDSLDAFADNKTLDKKLFKHGRNEPDGMGDTGQG